MSDKPNREAATAFQASGIRLQEALTPEGSTLRYVGGAARGHLGHGVRPCFLTLTLHHTVSVSGGVLQPMGWQQYSRPLWLSRGNHYILYLKAITAQMPI
jgi:hypothetical protein